MWAKLADDGVPHLDPLVRYARRMAARARARPTVARTVLVQGDTGPGNFVFDKGKVTGIVDWEFAHVGDPMDDWAWLDMRLPDADLTELQDRYSRATGIAIDHERIRYYRAAVDYRCAVTTSLAVSRGGGARGWAPYLLVTERYVLGLADRLAALLGVVETADLPAVVADPAHAVVRPPARRHPRRDTRDRRRRRCATTPATSRSSCTTSARTTRSAPRSRSSIASTASTTLGDDALDESRFAEIVERRARRRRARAALPAPAHATRAPALGDPARPPPPLTHTPNLASADGRYTPFVDARFVVRGCGGRRGAGGR